jgi:prolyl-tRNA synthetase
MRGREFLMKDAYSFHANEEDAKREYQNMYDTYGRIFSRCGLAFRAVEADTGAIGGSMSHEFQVLAETGEDALVACDNCSYAANVEEAKVRPEPPAAASGAAAPALEQVATPGKRTIEEVSGFLGVAPTALVKTLIYLADGQPVAVLVRGDRTVNEIKLKAAL